MSSLSVLSRALNSGSALIHVPANTPVAPEPTARLLATDCGPHRRTPGDDLAGGTVPRRDRGSHLIEPLEPVSVIEGQPCGRIGDDRPVTWKQLDDVPG